MNVRRHHRGWIPHSGWGATLAGRCTHEASKRGTAGWLVHRRSEPEIEEEEEIEIEENESLAASAPPGAALESSRAADVRPRYRVRGSDEQEEVHLVNYACKALLKTGADDGARRVEIEAEELARGFEAEKEHQRKMAEERAEAQLKTFLPLCDEEAD